MTQLASKQWWRPSFQGAPDFMAEAITGAYKTATESVASSTTLQDDDELFCPVAANGVYQFEAVIQYDADAAGDLKMQFAGSATTSMQAFAIFNTVGAATSSDMQIANMNVSSVIQVGGFGAGTRSSVLVKGLLLVGATAGTFKLTWAQTTSSAVATRLFADSYLLLRQVA